MKSKHEGNLYIVEVPIKTNKTQEDYIEKQYEAACRFHNALINKCKKQYQRMLKESDYLRLKRKYNKISKCLTSVKEQIKAIEKQDKLSKQKKKDLKIKEKDLETEKKQISNSLSTIREDFKMTKFGFYSIAIEIRYCGVDRKKGKGFSNLIDSNQTLFISDCIYSSFESIIFSNAEIHYKKISDYDFLRGTSNRQTYIFDKKDMTLKNPKLGKMALIIKDNDTYKHEALSQHICYCGIKRKIIKGKNRYFAQITVKGEYPNTYKNKHPLGVGDVGIDIGTSTIALTGINETSFIELNPLIKKTNNEKRLLQRKVDRQKRANNPDCYNEDGTCIKGKKHKHKSNRQIKNQNKLKELYRKEAVYKKQFANEVANKVIEMGSRVKVEKMNFASLAKKSKKTEILEKTGKFKRKKRFGKSIAIHNPAAILATIKFKESMVGGDYIELDTKNIKASQYHHDTGEFIKSELKDRHKVINDEIIQRDLYSSFLLMCANENDMTIDQDKCDKYWDIFKENHDTTLKEICKKGISGTLKGVLGKEVIKAYKS